MAPRSRKPVPVADLVARLLAQRTGHPTRGSEATTLKVFDAFAKIGPPLVEHAEPAFFKAGVLTLTVEESTWLTELTFLKPQILERLNRALGGAVVKELRMRQGRIGRRKKAPPKAPPQITAAQRAQIEEWAAAIADGPLKEALSSAAARSLEQAGKKRPPYEGPPGPSPQHAEPAPAPEPVVHDRWAKDRDRWRDRKKQ